MTIYYGDSIAFAMSRAVGQPENGRGIVGAGLLSEVNMTKALRGAVPVADSQLAPQGNLYDPRLIPPNQPVVVSFGYNDANTAMASRASRNRYLNLAADRLVEIAQQAHGQPITLLGLKHLTHQNEYHIPDGNIDGMNQLLEQAMDEARKRARARGIPFNGDFMDLSGMSVARTSDGLHYTTGASRAIAARVSADGRAPETPRLQQVSMTAPGPTLTLTPALSRSEVMQIQDLLRQHGFDPGASDGRQGKNTNEALQDALRSRGFNPGTTDGVMGQNTLAAIRAFEGRSQGADNGQLDVSEVRQLLALPPRPRSPQTRA